MKEVLLGFDDVKTDKPLLHFLLSFLFAFIHVCLFYMVNSQYYLVSF